MSARPQVTDTGHTVTLVHRLYEARYPDGTREELFVLEVGSDDDVDERAKHRARKRWAEKQQITATTGRDAPQTS